MHAAEKLMVYYAMNLYLLHENDNALHLIEDSGSKIYGGPLYKANLKRIEGLVYLNKKEIDKSI